MSAGLPVDGFPGTSAAAGTAGTPGAVDLCDARALEEAGAAFVWDVLQHRRPARAFALRFDGNVRAYLNRCVHVPAEMDWQPGAFMDADRRYILCSIHGATYEPTDGRCVGGPCGRGRLTPLHTEERGGRVYWYPSPEVQPVASLQAGAMPGAASGPMRA